MNDYFFLNQRTVHRKHREHESSAPPQTAGPDASRFHGKRWLPEKWPFVRPHLAWLLLLPAQIFPSLTNNTKDPRAQTGLFFLLLLGWGGDYLPSQCSRTRVRSTAVEDNLQVRRREPQKVGLQGSYGWGGRVFVRSDRKPTFRLFLPDYCYCISSLLWLMLAKSK